MNADERGFGKQYPSGTFEWLIRIQDGYGSTRREPFALVNLRLSLLLPAVIGGMAGLHGDERAATRRRHFPMRDQLALDDGAVIA